MREIIDEVIRLLKDGMDGAVVEAHEVTKNNGQVRTGICIHPEDGMVGTMYYIDQMVEEGRTEADIAGHISSMYRKHYDTGVETVKSYFVDYESVKGALGLQLVHRDKNAGMLAGMSFKKFLDLAVIITAGVPMRGGGHAGRAAVKVDNALVKMWGRDAEEVYAKALENFRGEKTRIMEMGSLLAEAGYTPVLDGDGCPPMYIVTNQSGIYGASRLLDGDAVRGLAGRFGTDLAMLPSSIHEAIFIPLLEGADIQELSAIVQMVNSSDVVPEEVLSDHAYIYRLKTGWEYSEN